MADTPALDSTWINDNLYKGYLGREADQEGLDYWTAQAQSPGMDAVRLMGDFRSSVDANLRDATLGTKQALAPALFGSAQPPPTTPEVTQNYAPVQTQDWAGLIGDIAQPTNAAREIQPLETVSGQLQRLIDQDSPYIQSARNRGMETANARGLINSSLAAGTSERAAIDAAAPIAGQDASTYAASGLSAQNANQELNQSQYTAGLKTVADQQSLYNSATVQGLAGQISSDLQRQQDLAKSALQAQAASETSALQAQKDQATAQLQTTLTQMGLDVDLKKLESNDRNAFVTASAPVVQQYMQQYTAIQTQPNSVMNQEAKRAALYQLEVGYKANLTSISSIMGYDIDWGEITTPPAADPPAAVNDDD